ncbi:MAG: M17 family peptidase N-terminal domain-containing protein [Myxococcota bacterium]
MKPALTVEVASDSLERIRADVLVVGVAPTDRPLRGAAGYADWRLCGRLWELVSAGRIPGVRGQASLVIPGGGLQTRLLLVLGLGQRHLLDLSAWQELGRDATDRSLGLRAETVALAIVQDGLIDRPTAHQERSEAVAGLISGAARAVGVRGTCLRLTLLGTPSAVIEDALVPAGVEVRLPGSTPSTKLPSAPSGTQAPV